MREDSLTVFIVAVVPVVLAEQDECDGQEKEAVEEAEDHAQEEYLQGTGVSSQEARYSVQIKGLTLR